MIPTTEFACNMTHFRYYIGAGCAFCSFGDCNRFVHGLGPLRPLIQSKPDHATTYLRTLHQSSMSAIDIPVIDISSRNTNAASQLLAAAANNGFVFIKNNDAGVEAKDIESMFNLVSGVLIEGNSRSRFVDLLDRAANSSRVPRK